jgi:hypothetical protein
MIDSTDILHPSAAPRFKTTQVPPAVSTFQHHTKEIMLQM